MSASKVKWVRLGDYIEPCDERNTEEKYTLDDVRGISIEKKLIFTKADMKDVSLKPYKLLKPREFCYVSVTSRNGGKISLAINVTQNTYIVSSSYVNFRSKDKDILLPEYLFVFLSLPEFDRYSRFNSWGSARETFDWNEMCRVRIPLPSIAVQRELVDTYNGLKALAEQNEAVVASLAKMCEALVVEAGKKYTHVALGEYISQITDKNNDNTYSIDDVQGVNSAGQFDETRANTEGLDFSKYKIVRINNFAYNPSRINLGSIAIRKTSNCIVSPMYIVFGVNSDNLIPEYLNCCLSRKEFLRSTLYYAMGSVRDTFDYGLMEETRIPLPPIEVQQSIVNLYHCMEEAKSIAATARERLKALCPALVLRGANA